MAYTRLQLVALVALVVGCASTPPLSHQTPPVNSFWSKLDSLFVQAYSSFDSGHYSRAIQEFQRLQLLDTGFAHYESFAFVAESYRLLGLPQRGFIVYDSLEASYRRFADRHPNNFDVGLSLEEIQYMRSIYPTFPVFLTRQGGFVPTDSIPQVLANPAPRYPEKELHEGVEGNAYLRVQLAGTGAIEQVTVDSMTASAFAVASLEALKGWRFSPYKRKGRLSRIEVRVPFRFRISNRRPAPTPTRLEH